jgi:MSHA biogenesis protein MshM
MYYDYFGFNQPPFRITPDTNMFYPGGNRGAILDALVYAIQNGEGIVKVVGEVGSGKTMLCRMLEKELPDNIEVVYLVNPRISPENTLHAIAFELKLDVKSDTSRFEVMNKLQQYLLQKHSENFQVVVFVEEAQSMPIATLEEIRLLTNLETQQSKLLQIVLFGQPELDEMIAQVEIRQLKERITYSFDLTPFKTNDIREYLNTRIRVCGYRSGELFDSAAIKKIEKYSQGLLRRINIIADKSLLAAYADNARQVSVKHTKLAARDSEFITKPVWFKLPIVLSVTAVIAVLIISSYLLIHRDDIDFPLLKNSTGEFNLDACMSSKPFGLRAV